MTPEFSFLYVPIDNQENAQKVAQALVQQKLAVCVNIIPAVTSVYEWEGKIESGSELIMLIKTNKNKIQSARDTVAALHPYKVPCIAEIPIYTLNSTYQAWAESILKL